MRVLVTGATGFLGSALLRRACDTSSPAFAKTEGWSFVAMGRNTSLKSRRRLTDDHAVLHCLRTGRVSLVWGDLTGDVSGLCERVDAVVHCGARTFVDHSVRDVRPFLDSNVVGTVNLLEDARRHGVGRFLQVSTDEVYGSCDGEGAHTEESPLRPRNPYAASKAAADMFALSYAHTHGLHTTVTRTENLYGPWQHPQKVIPTFVREALKGNPLPVYGDGLHRRRWLWVDDQVDALLGLLTHDHAPGEVYHVAASHELTNLELAGMVLSALDLPADQVRHVDDAKVRPGHDRRYAIDASKITAATGWAPTVAPAEGIARAVRWYESNRWWLD